MSETNIPHRSIRIFISSTFRDMHSERDYLVKIIFPELSQRCLKKGLHMVPVDLRWGVTEEEAEKGKALEICLDEIENCRPFFIGLLGERYGWVPPAYKVPDQERYDWLNHFDKGHSITALEIYQGVLKSQDMRSRAFFYFRNPDFIKEVPEVKRADIEAESEESANKLKVLKQRIVDAYTKDGLPGHYTESYSCEYEGIRVNWLQVKADLGNALGHEDIEAIDALISASGMVEMSRFDSLSEVQKAIVEKYGVVYLKGLEDFGNEVLEDLWQAILAEYPDEIEKEDPLTVERAWHERFLFDRTHLFVGREDTIADIMQALLNENNQKPLFLHGAPGSGKSALTAMCCLNFRKLYPDAFVLPRFVGLSPASSDIFKLLTNIVEELAAHFQLTFDREKLEEIDLLKELFRELLFRIHSLGHKVFIVMDAVNQLSNAYDPHFLTWLPKVLPQNVHILLSTLDGPFLDAAQRFEIPVVKVEGLSPENRREMVKRLLGDYRKGLDERQMNSLLKKRESDRPLFLSVASEELRIFPSFELINTRIQMLPDYTPELFEQVLERLEYDHDKRLVRDALSFLECSMFGLHESELLELLRRGDEHALPANIWARIHRSIGHYMSNAGDTREGLMSFFHQQFSLAVQVRYLQQKDAQLYYYSKLADYGLDKFGQKPTVVSNTLRYAAVYLYQSERIEEVNSLVVDIFADKFNQELYQVMVSELFDFVVKNRNADEETLLSDWLNEISLKNANEDFLAYLEKKAFIYLKTGYSQWAMKLYVACELALRQLISEFPQRNELLIQQCKMLLKIGDIFLILGESPKALQQYQVAREKVQEIALRFPESPDFINTLAEATIQIADYYFKFGEGPKAILSFNEALLHQQKLHDSHPENVTFSNNLANAYTKTAHVYENLGDYILAKDYYLKAFEITEKCYNLNKEDATQLYALAVSYNYLGDFFENTSDLNEAWHYDQLFYQSMEKLAGMEPSRLDYRQVLGYSFYSLARVCELKQENLKALEYYKKYLSIMQELTKLEPGHFDFKWDLTVCFNRTARVYEKLGDYEKALEFLNVDLKLTSELVATEPLLTNLRKDLAITNRNMGEISLKKNALSEALAFFRISNEIMEQVLDAEPDFKEYIVEYARGLLHLAECSADGDKHGLLSKAKALIEPHMREEIVHAEMQEVWQKIIENSGNI